MTNSIIRLPAAQEWQAELEDLIRGASGGFLFGIPLPYTMEVWWIGSYLEPPLMLVILAVTFVIVFLLNRTDGFRQISPDRPLQAAMDSIEAIALMLWFFHRLNWTDPWTSWLRQVVILGLSATIGGAAGRLAV